MCGIVGFTGFSKEDSERIAAAQQRRLWHRGPDGHGTWFDSDTGLLFSHLRLAVIDLTDAGAQPMTSPDGSKVLVFNGEIYNAPSLRSELEVLGRAFRGHSDTEVLLAGLEEWGVPGMLARCVGMFAFAYWNRVSRKLVLARDRFGEKPLYYFSGSGRFAFSSQPGAFLDLPGFDASIDRDSLRAYFRHGFVRGSNSIYVGVRRLPPGTYIELTSGNWGTDDLPAPVSYWNHRRLAEGPVPSSMAEAVGQLESLIDRSVALQSVADVPLGAFLSGGIDSSVVVASMQAQSARPVKTFCIGFKEPRFDESSHARAVARHLGTDHCELIIGQKDAMAVVPEIPRIWDEPFADASQIPTYIVAKLARQSVTVALSGDGGDELFHGYTRFFELERRWRGSCRIPGAARRLLAGGIGLVPEACWDAVANCAPTESIKIRQKFLQESARRFAKLLVTESPGELYRDMVSCFDDPSDIVMGGIERRDGPWDQYPCSGDVISAAASWDMGCYLPDDILTKVDRASMAVSLEARVPLLDFRIAEFASRLPSSFKSDGCVGKLILREVLYKRVPKALVDRPKKGFGIPIGEWIRYELREWAESLLDEKGLESEGLLDVKKVRTLWIEHVSGRRDWGGRLWTVLMFQAWLRGRRLA